MSYSLFDLYSHSRTQDCPLELVLQKEGYATQHMFETNGGTAQRTAFGALLVTSQALSSEQGDKQTSEKRRLHIENDLSG